MVLLQAALLCQLGCACKKGQIAEFSISHASQWGVHFQFIYNDGELLIKGRDIDRGENLRKAETEEDDANVEQKQGAEARLVTHWISRLNNDRQVKICQALASIDVAKLKKEYRSELAGLDPTWLKFSFSTSQGNQIVVDYCDDDVPELARLVETIDEAVPLLYRFYLK